MSYQNTTQSRETRIQNRRKYFSLHTYTIRTDTQTRKYPCQWLLVTNTQWVGCCMNRGQWGVRGRRDNQDHRDGWEVIRTIDLLARQLVNTMYEVTVSSVDAVGLLRVVAAPRMAHAWWWGGGGGGHYRRTVETKWELCDGQKKSRSMPRFATYLPHLLTEQKSVNRSLSFFFSTFCVGGSHVSALAAALQLTAAAFVNGRMLSLTHHLLKSVLPHTNNNLF